MFVQDPTFGRIVDFERMRREIRDIYDHIEPEFNLLGVVHTLTRLSRDVPSMSIALGASTLAYSLLAAAEEHELAEEHKDKLFTLGWTEEHCGSDLLSIRTTATPVSDDPDERQYHVQGRKWLINNSFHADFHVVVAKIDPNAKGPRSLSLFLVPRSSTRGWERLDTHVLRKMVLTTFEIDGPATLLGKPGQGLTIIQRMANISRPQCTYTGVAMVRESVPAAIDHLSSKRIFGDHPVRFSNVYRQLYQIVLRAAFYEWQLYRNVALGGGGFLQFYGTQLKSWLLLRINELLGHTLLVTGSKGFLAESVIGRDAIDSFVLPVFDGHYTINTLMTDKHARRYLNAEEPADLEARLSTLRRDAYIERVRNEIHADHRSLRRPPFFDWADYLARMELPLELPAPEMVEAARALLLQLREDGSRREAEMRYKIGDLVHWMESILSAAELWAVTSEPAYLDIVALQWNGTVETFNRIVSENALPLGFLTPVRQGPLSPADDPQAWLLGLLDVRGRIARPSMGTSDSLASNARASGTHAGQAKPDQDGVEQEQATVTS